MGQIKDPLRQKRDNKANDCTPIIPMEKPKTCPDKKNPNLRYSDDGFWTTTHPIAKAFSKEWFKTHLSMIPYCWAMFKMAISVSKISVATIVFGTIARAIVDAAQLYAYTRFVNEVFPQYSF
jgi:hypothetical protein